MLFVTGATGFVGRNVVRAFASRGHPLRCLVHNPERSKAIQGRQVETVKGDLLDIQSLHEAMRGVDAVVHLVAVIREKGRYTFERVNHEGTRNLVQAAKQAGVKRFIKVSTIGAAEDPSVPYLYSRWKGEQEVVNSGIPYTIIRSSLIFGEGDEFFNTLAALVKALPVVPIAGDGKARFQPIAVEDVAECVAKAYENQAMSGRIIEVGGPDYFTYDEIIDLVSETLRLRSFKAHVPLAVMRPLVKVMDVLLPKPPATPEQLKMLKIDSIADLKAVEQNFGFAPRSPRGNIGYIKRVSYIDAMKIVMGFMPTHIRDH